MRTPAVREDTEWAVIEANFRIKIINSKILDTT